MAKPGGVSTVAAAAAYHTHSTSVVVVALLRACHAHADIDAVCGTDCRRATWCSGCRQRSWQLAGGACDVEQRRAIVMVQGRHDDRRCQRDEKCVGEASGGRHRNNKRGGRPGSSDPGLTVDRDEVKVVWLRFGISDDRGEMEVMRAATEKENFPRVATVINVILRPRRIWNVLIIAVVMNDLDRGKDDPAVVGSDGATTSFVGDGNMVAASGGGCWQNGSVVVAHRRMVPSPVVATMAATHLM
ncbi:hypothetical protein ACLOJK_014998 [Asimina triloba]